MNLPRIIQKRLLTCKEAAQYLGISERQLEYLRAEGLIKQTRLPDTRKRLYDIVDLDAFIEKAKIS
ncbi:helix-turn-helix domain-containing protein [candidate division KSB1 bacterium]|nr:helix-turn-helix domain-containing protein [candidate division KSB1 bacterium]